MEIKGKVHCFFEQSGTFKNEFIKLGYNAECYDIQNNFGQTDHVIDLFAETETAYRGGVSVWDSISCNDLVMAFFPCIYFESLSMMAFSWTARNYRKKTKEEALELIMKRAKDRYDMYIRLLELVGVATKKGVPLIIENPWSMQHYLKQGNFVQPPSVVDMDRTRRGDYFRKPTAYWFFNCEPTSGCSFQPTPKDKIKDILHSKKAPHAGLCSEERSMISPDYARNFICDFILGKEQEQFGKQLSFF